jgi:hypothetical protein
MGFPVSGVSDKAILLALDGELPQNKYNVCCLPEEGSCEWWRAQRGQLAEKLMEWSLCDIQKTVETGTHTFDYARGARELRILLAWIDSCGGRQKKPWSGSYNAVPICDPQNHREYGNGGRGPWA